MSAWQPDRLLPGFEALELRFPDDYDGAVVATLVRLPVGDAPAGAVLYVHGFSDYFFQRHMAERFALVMPSIRSLPAFTIGSEASRLLKLSCTCPAMRS